MQNLKTVCHRVEKKRKIENDKTIPPSRQAVPPPAEVTFAIKAFLATVCHRGRVAEYFNKNNPSVTLSRATSLASEAKVTLASKIKLGLFANKARAHYVAL